MSLYVNGTKRREDVWCVCQNLTANLRLSNFHWRKNRGGSIPPMPSGQGGNARGLLLLDFDKHIYGGIAQLGERLPCTQKVVGSIPTGSTKYVVLVRNFKVYL